MERDVFCQIVAGDIPSVKVWEDDDFLAILDINPNREGVTIIMSKKHYDSDFSELPAHVAAGFVNASQKVAKLLKKGLGVSRVIMVADVIEATACRDLYAAAAPGLRMRASGIGGATVLIAPTLPVPYFNRVIGLGNDAAAREDDIERVMAAYSSEAISTYWIHRIPSAQPASLASLLEHRGFTPAPRGSWAKFLRGVDDVPAIRTDLRLREAKPDDAIAVAHVVTSAYGMPAPVGPWFSALIGRAGWQVWVAELGGRVVAAGALFVQGDTGWIGAGATLAEYRGRGAQRALLSARIDAAAARGCRVLGTETGEPIAAEPSPSYANIVRVGFTRVCSRMNYAPSAQT